MLNIALTKGRLEDETIKLLKRASYGVEAFANKGRKLVIHDEKKDVRYFLVKAADCITYLEHGVADVAVVGKDVIMENENSCYELLDLGFGKCAFVLAALDKDILKKTSYIKIGTKYPNVAKNYFKTLGLDAQIIKIDGSVELAPLLDLTDGIIDIMETGTTLKENGLIVLNRICEISARMLVNPGSFRVKREQVLSLLKDLEDVIEVKK